MAVIITAEWFDGEVPNPLHPIGWLIDPVRRVVHVPVTDGYPLFLNVGDSIGDDGSIYRMGVTRPQGRRAILAEAEPEPTLKEIWRDQ